jgi:hypothetical protein
MLRHVCIAACLLSTLTACHSSSDTKPSSLATASSGLVFTASTSTSWPWQNNLYRLNPETFEVEALLTGESNDAVVFNLDHEVLLFNRSTDSLNFRSIVPDADQKTLKVGDQTQFADAFVGDPHDVIELDSDTALLSHYNLGKLSVMKISTGEKLGEVAAEWDLPADVPLKPEALWRTHVGPKTFIYVVHQAYAFEGNLFTVNGTQTVFVLEQSGSTLTPVDLDPSLPKIQGIKIKGSFAQVIESTERAQSEKLVLSSLCSRFVSPSELNPQNVCKSIVEEIDPLTQTVKTLWDLDDAGLFMNGSTVSAGAKGVFFAQVEEQTADGSFARRIVKLDPYAKTKSPVYDYAEGSGGYYGLYYDDMRGNLFIGDINNDTVGKFTILKADGTSVVKAIEGIPYSGAFID